MGRGGSSGGRSSGGSSGGGSRSSGGYHGGSSYSRGGSASRRTRIGGAPRTSYIITPGVERVVGHIRRGWDHISYVLCLLIFLILLVYTYGDVTVTKSTIDREPLESSAVVTTDYYTDTIGWVESKSRLETGMKTFFKKTGIQPYLYLTETVNGNPNPTDEEMEAFAEALYDELFEDEGHLLVVFQEYNSNSNYFVWCVAGKQAKVVFDSEARDIFFDYIDRYYTSDLDTSDYFSKVFEKTSIRMMSVTINPLGVIVVAFAALAIIFIAFKWWKKAKEQKNLEAEQNERILNSTLGRLADDEELENKYKE